MSTALEGRHEHDFDPEHEAALHEDAPVVEGYRALCALAVSGLVLGVLSLLTLLNWSFGLLALAGIVVSLAGILKIRKYPTELTGMPLAKTGLVLSVVCLAVGWTWSAYRYVTEVPEGYSRLTFRELQTPKEQPALAPDEVRQFEGEKVFVKGFIRPGSKTKGLQQFLLVADDETCCFGENLPVPGDMIDVTLVDPLKIDYSGRLFHVGGTLDIHWQPIPGQSGILYHLKADYVK